MDDARNDLSEATSVKLVELLDARFADVTQVAIQVGPAVDTPTLPGARICLSQSFGKKPRVHPARRRSHPNGETEGATRAARTRGAVLEFWRLPPVEKGRP